MSSKNEKIIIYTDGACSGNQESNNLGGWGAVLTYASNKPREIWGAEKNTTNNRMEMTACIRALEELKRDDMIVEIYSDSAYIVNCFKQKWYVKWQRNGWKNSKKEPVENKDLWVRLLELVNQYQPTFVKVKGHAGIELNERADRLANRGVDSLR